MTPDQEQAVIRETVARRDLEDIKFLRECAPFQRYFMRRIRDKQETIAERFRNDPPSKCTHEEREILRRLLNEYDDIAGMLEIDQGAARNELARMA